MATRVHQTYQYRGYCKRKGYERLEEVLTMCGWLYNAALQERRDAYKMRGEPRTLYDQHKEFTGVRADLPEWRDMSVQVGRGVLKRVDRAFQAFFSRVKSEQTPGFPRFRPSSRNRTIEVAVPTAAMVKRSSDGRHAYVKVKGLPTIKLRTKRSLPEGKPVSLMITRRPIGWVVSLGFAVELESEKLSEGRWDALGSGQNDNPDSATDSSCGADAPKSGGVPNFILNTCHLPPDADAPKSVGLDMGVSSASCFPMARWSSGVKLTAHAKPDSGRRCRVLRRAAICAASVLRCFLVRPTGTQYGIETPAIDSQRAWPDGSSSSPSKTWRYRI